jgi:hypothetical protein
MRLDRRPICVDVLAIERQNASEGECIGMQGTPKESMQVLGWLRGIDSELLLLKVPPAEEEITSKLKRSRSWSARSEAWLSQRP